MKKPKKPKKTKPQPCFSGLNNPHLDKLFANSKTEDMIKDKSNGTCFQVPAVNKLPVTMVPFAVVGKCDACGYSLVTGETLDEHIVSLHITMEGLCDIC